MERCGARGAQPATGGAEAMRLALLLAVALISGCSALEAAYWCGKAPPGPGFCPVAKQ